MGIKIVAHGYLGTLKRQEMSTNDYTSTLSSILNSGGILAPVTIEKNKVFSYWGVTIDSYDIGKYSINQLIGLGFVTENNILNIYANYSYMANNVQITLNANGGKFSDGSTTKILSKPVGTIYAELLDNIVTLPTRDNITFYKWTDESGSTINGNSEFTKSTVLTANWVVHPNTIINVSDSFGNSIKSNYVFSKKSMWKDILPDIIKNYNSPLKTKALKDVIPGYGSFYGQKIKQINFTNKGQSTKIGWLSGSIYEAANADVSLYTNRNLLIGTNTNSNFSMGSGNGSFTTKYVAFANGYKWQLQTQRASTDYSYIQHKGLDISKFKPDTDYTISFMLNTNVDFYPGVMFITGDARGNFINQISKPKILASEGDQIVKIKVHTYSIPADIGQTLYINGFVGLSATISFWDLKINEDSYSPYSKAPEDINKKIRDFSATTVPIDPDKRFSLTGQTSSKNILQNSPRDNYTYKTPYNRIMNSNVSIVASSSNPYPYKELKLYDDPSKLSGKKFTMSVNVKYTNVTSINSTGFVRALFEFEFSDTVSKRNIQPSLAKTPTALGESFDGRISLTFDATNMIFSSDHIREGLYIQGFTADYIEVGYPKLEIEETASIYEPAPEDNKPGLWLDNIWLYNPYTRKWNDRELDYNDYLYKNGVITFKDVFNTISMNGDLSYLRPQITTLVNTTIADYGSTNNNQSIYPASYFPDDDNGVVLNIEELLGYAYVEFNNPFTGYSEKVYKAVGTPFSEFLKSLNISNFQKNGQFLKGFFVKGYYNISKLISTDMIQSNTTLAVAKYAEQSTGTFSNITLNANGGLFYPGTSNQTDQIKMNVQNDDTYSIISNFAPPMAKRTMSLLYWARNLTDMEPAYPFKVVDNSTIYSKWTVQGGTELKRKPREFYLIDADTIFNGWDMMDKYSISEKNNIFVIDPTGVGTAFSNDITSSLDGWGNTKRQIESNNIEFDAYYNGYDQYNKLGSWLRGKRLVLAMLNETNSPTYWGIQLENIERTEIKYGTDMLKGKLAFKKTSPAFDLEFIGIGTDNIIDNADDMFRRNAYVYIHSMKIPDVDTGIQIMANDGTKVIQDSVAVSLPAGSYFEYSTIPFKEAWRYGDSWTNMPNNLYNNIIDLVTSKSLKLGIGKWDITVSSSTKVIINSLKPNTIGYYKGRTIDSLGGIGPFTGIAIKEKEL